MNIRHQVLLFLSVLGVIKCCHGQKEDTDTFLSQFMADLWQEGAEVFRIIWKDCSKKLFEVKDIIDSKDYFPKFVRCMRRKTLRALDRSLSPDVVPIADGVSLVRFEVVDRSGNIVAENDNSTWTEKELDEGEWRILALQRMSKVLRTHVIKFDLDDINSVEKVEFRGRRRHHMMTVMMFGIVSIGMVMVPMGFQFLAVLGGKALMLAKLALILASIQGLKKVDILNKDDQRGKIAANPMNYGLYHPYSPYDNFEKRSNSGWSPSNFKIATSPSQTKENSPRHNKHTADIIEVIRLQSTKEKEAKSKTKNSNIGVIKPEVPKAIKKATEPRLFPVYNGQPDLIEPMFIGSDLPAPIADLTTKPGEIQADYLFDFPFNRFQLKSSTPVVSA